VEPTKGNSLLSGTGGPRARSRRSAGDGDHGIDDHRETAKQVSVDCLRRRPAPCRHNIGSRGARRQRPFDPQLAVLRPDQSDVGALARGTPKGRGPWPRQHAVAVWRSLMEPRPGHVAPGSAVVDRRARPARRIRRSTWLPPQARTRSTSQTAGGRTAQPCR
jgi:hypothetical protein